MRTINLTDAEIAFIKDVFLDPSLDICQNCKFKPKKVDEDCNEGFCDRLALKISKSITGRKPKGGVKSC